MATNQDLPATDSAAVLHELVGDDATAAFESDPKFVDSNPGDSSSSNNLQTPADRRDIRAEPDVQISAAAADEEDEDEEEEDDDDEDDDLEDDDEEDEDDEDDEEEYEDTDDDDDEDDEDEEEDA